MEPVTMIVSAIALGATAGLQESTATAVREAYAALKRLIRARYQDVDGDAIPYRTLPGTHPTKGAFFTRGTSHDENARYTEDGHVHARVIDRIRRKFDTAATLVPKPEISENPGLGVGEFALSLLEIPRVRGWASQTNRYCTHGASCQELRIEGVAVPNPDGSGEGMWLSELGQDAAEEAEHGRGQEPEWVCEEGVDPVRQVDAVRPH